ncbi:MAG TPA: hypothetical protein VIF60_02030 [Burkholderiaceae bacterium]
MNTNKLSDTRWPPDRRDMRAFVLFMAAVLHLAVLYNLHTSKLRAQVARQPRTDEDESLTMVWINQEKRPREAAPKPTTPRNRAAMQQSARATAPSANKPEAKTAAAVDAPAAGPRVSPPRRLDPLQILNSAGADASKFDHEHPEEKIVATGPRLASLESRIEDALANGKPPPKWYESARIEEISSGGQLDASTRIYKITTFAGSYCVTYHDNEPPVKSLCPIRF